MTETAFNTIVSRPNAKGVIKFYVDGRERGYRTEQDARNAVRELSAATVTLIYDDVPVAAARGSEVLGPVMSTVRSDFPGLNPESYWARRDGEIKWSGPFARRGEVDVFLCRA